MAAGDELLVVDATTAHREGMRKLFESQGYVVTCAGTAAEALEAADRALFSVALIELDLAQEDGGLPLLRDLAQRSPDTACVLLAERPSFEASVEALRLGAVDVVLLRSKGLAAQLRQAVERASKGRRRSTPDSSFMTEVKQVLDESFRIQLEMAREVYGDVSIAAMEGFAPRILVVDEDQNALRELGGMIGDRKWEVSVEMTGGSALDKAGDHDFELVACGAELVDLPGSMVVKTIQARRPETVGLVYGGAGESSRLERYREGRRADVETPFAGMAQLLKAIAQEVDALATTGRDRSVIQAFRGAHPEFFRRFAELKLRLERVAD